MPPTIDTTTAELAERVMGWRAAPDRFLKSGRVWIPRWRFQPFRNIEDALTLLDAAKPAEYCISGGKKQVTVRVLISGNCGHMSGLSRPAVITAAIAIALRIEVPAGTSLPLPLITRPVDSKKEESHG